MLTSRKRNIKKEMFQPTRVHGCKDIMELHVTFFVFFICIASTVIDTQNFVGGQHRWAPVYLAACHHIYIIIFYTCISLANKNCCFCCCVKCIPGTR